MNELNAVLSAFLAGQAEFAQVDAVLAQSLKVDPTIAPSAFAAIDQIYKSGRLPLQLYVLLKNRIAQSHAAARAQTQASAPPPPAPSPAAPPAQDRTIFNPAAARTPPSQAAQPQAASAPPPPPPPPPREEPAAPRAFEPEPPPADRTIMRGRPPPPAPGAQPHGPPREAHAPAAFAAGPATGGTGPVTGAEAPSNGSFDLGHSAGPSETSQTGASTGRTSSTGTGRTGTGTGSSSWTDPAKWDERPQVVLERGSVLKGRFVLESVVGRGGMGVVFRAKDLRKEEAQDRDPYVAIKILNDEFRRHPESLKALQREARKSQQLAHPNIVSVFDFDRDGGTVYMTMEFLEGEALDRIIKNPKFEGMSLAEAYPLIKGLGAALSYAHDKGIVHSDFKPGNCFLTKSGVIKVFDFGIAQAAKLKGDLQGEETKFDAGSLGALTPAYASCEMIAGEQPDTRDDVYALGCVVYEMLTGKHPFGKKSAADARDQKLVPPQIKQLTRRQWRAIEKSLAFRRADRSASVWELVDGLAKQQLFSAPRIAVGAAAVVVIGVGAYFGVGVWQQAQRDRLVAALSSRDDTQVPAALERVTALAGDDRNALLTQVTGPLLDWYEKRIDAAANKAAGRYDYPRAAAIAEEAKRWYPDSARIQKKAQDTAQEGAQLAVDLVAQFGEALDAGRLLPDPANVDVAEVLDILSQVQPDHQTLQSPSLAIAYAQKASEALRARDPDVVRAAALLDAGLKRFPGNEQLVGVQARLEDVRKAADEADRLARLKKTLDDSTGRTVAELLALKDTAGDLVNLSPDDASLRAYRGRLSAALRDEVQTAVTARDLDKAQGLLDSVDETLLPLDLKREPQNRIADARRARDKQRQDLLAAITNAASAGDAARLTDAEARLSELRGLPGVDANTVQTAHDRVLEGYLALAQKQNNDNQFARAKATVTQGLAFEPNHTDLLAMQQTIADREDAVAKGNKAAADEALAKAQQALRDDVQKILAKPTLSYVDAKDALDKMKKLPEGDPLAGAAGTDQVAQKLANQARALGTSQQQWQQAVAQLEQALNLIPGSAILEGARADAQRSLQAVLVAQVQRTLEQRMASATDDEAWSKGVRDLITQLRGLVPEGDPSVAKAERDAATALVARAAQARDRKDFNVAERLLRSAGSFAPGLSELAAEQQRVAAAKDAATQVVISERQKLDAQIADLKTLLETQAKADNPAGVVKARDDLKKLAPNDPYLDTARQKIADVYLHVATNRLADKEYDNAERFAQQGLRELPGYQPLVALAEKVAEARGRESGAALDRDIDALRAQIQAGSGDANAAKALRERIRSTAPEARFSALVQELVGIADQRLASNPNDDAYRAFASTALDRPFARAVAPPPPPPVASGVPCTDSLKGTKRACYDAVPGATSDRGPIMVVVPGGSGVSGSFAIGRTEVTVGNWNDYCKLSGVGGGDGQCKPAAGGVNDPVASLAVADIEKYAAWLSATTKATYRLPSSAEWLHAATATGEPIKNANCIDPAGRGKAPRDTAQNLGQDNAWGLRDVLGNVQEIAKTASGYEVRGGHFNNQLGQCRLDSVQSYDGRPAPVTGFRLVRELGPG